MAWRHTARPLERTRQIWNRRGTVPFAYRVGRPDEYVFTVDFYAYRERDHPQRHLGWWRFALPPGRGSAELAFDFTTIERGSVSVRTADAALEGLDAWWNPAFAFDPLGDLEFVFRDPAGAVRAVAPAVLKFMDRDIIREFYARHYETSGYRPPDERPFLHQLHAYKLGTLERLFLRHIPRGGTVVDVGCGRSLFADIGAAFPFKVVAGDLDFASVRDRAREVAAQQWAVFDVEALPFPNGSFDALFAGEVIEHVPNAVDTLREWSRVLKPGGVAIITTPNRDRLVARVNRMELPYSPDHLGEVSYRELTRRLLPGAGFEFVEQACIYLELWLQHLFQGSGRIEDFLQREGNIPKNVPVMRRLFPLGRFAPSASLAMIVVARKPAVNRRGRRAS